MPDFKQTFQDEVRRLARKELKALDTKIAEQKTRGQNRQRMTSSEAVAFASIQTASGG